MKEHFTDTIFYQIELTAKYCKMLGNQVFQKFNTNITVDEYAILDILICNNNMCQRDLAKMLLKDRANTGKLLDTLEKKGFVERKLSIKNNRPVKIIEITEKGKEIVFDTADKIRPHYIEVKDKINNSDLSKVGGLLQELRQVLKDTITIEI